MSLRDQIKTSLTISMKERDMERVGTLRLIISSIKDKDIADRVKGNQNGIGQEQILQLLQTMIKQRRESIDLYEKGDRQDLADKEAFEIQVIQEFLPIPLTGPEIDQAIEATIGELQATSVKDLGRIITSLKEKYIGRIDFSTVAGQIKQKLST